MDNVSIELWNQDATVKYGNLDKEAYDISYSTASPGGFKDFTCTVVRHPREYFEDIALCNIVRVYFDSEVVWEGEITDINRAFGESSEIQIAATGHVNRLKKRYTTEIFGAGGYGSDWILGYLLLDSDLNMYPDPFLLSNYISPADYAYPYGLDISPEMSYYDIMEKINECNAWRWEVWEKALADMSLVGGSLVVTKGQIRFVFEPWATAPEYIVYIEDCKGEINYNLDDIINYIHYTYTSDGTEYISGWYPNTTLGGAQDGPDPTSQALYKRRDGSMSFQEAIDATTPTAATSQLATMLKTALDLNKVMRPNTSITTTKLYAADGKTEIPLQSAQAGRVVEIRNLFPGELSLTQKQAVNELSTFRCVETSLAVADEMLSLSPGSGSISIDTMLAQLSANTNRNTE